MDDDLRQVPTGVVSLQARGSGGEQGTSPITVGGASEARVTDRNSVEASSTVTPYEALSEQNYLFCRVIEDLGAWAYGQRIVDRMQEELKLEIDPSISYTLAKRLSGRGVIKGQDTTSPDGTKRRVRVYQLTPTGRELVRLTQLWLKDQETARRRTQASDAKAGTNRKGVLDGKRRRRGAGGVQQDSGGN